MNLNKSQRLWLRGYLEALANELDNEFEEFQAYFKENEEIGIKKLVEFKELTNELINTTEVLVELWTNLSDEENALKNIASAKSNLDVYYQAGKFAYLAIKDGFAEVEIRI